MTMRREEVKEVERTRRSSSFIGVCSSISNNNNNNNNSDDGTTTANLICRSSRRIIQQRRRISLQLLLSTLLLLGATTQFATVVSSYLLSKATIPSSTTSTTSTSSSHQLPPTRRWRSAFQYPSTTNRRRRRRYNNDAVVPSSNTALASSSDSESESDSSTSSTTTNTPAVGTERNGVTFLGKNEDAIVRLGSVLLSPRHEFHHYYRKAAIYIYAMGNDGNENDGNNENENGGVYVIRGLILDHPTPFTLKDLMNGLDEEEEEKNGSANPLMDNSVFRGGDKGGEGVILLHNQPNVRNAIEVGENTGLYTGGWDDALLKASEDSTSSVDNNYKIFFNYCEFTEVELENMLKESTSSDEEGGDGWVSVQVDPSLILSHEYVNRGDAWMRFRNAVAQM